MEFTFELKYKDDKNISPKIIFETNVLSLEKLCRKALAEKATVSLISPEQITSPKTVYELSVMLAEDLVKKYNSENIILR